jgi:hypothetical protein
MPQTSSLFYFNKQRKMVSGILASLIVEVIKVTTINKFAIKISWCALPHEQSCASPHIIYLDAKAENDELR